MEEASAYIARNWSSTVRYATEDQGTLIGLPRPFSTPSISGVFQELYYWDTYFINVGLLASGQTEQAANNIENMFYLIDRFGWMPNGNRTFYLCRSQPPFLSQMVRELFAHTQDQAWLRAGAYPALQQEYRFWHTHRTLENGLSRYGGEDPDDTTLRELGKSLCKRFGLASPESPERLYPYGRAMLALAESGWDCTSRFGTEAQLYAPVDLNALLYRMERNMEWFAGVLGLDAERSQWRSRKEFRKARMDELLWEPERGCYCDYRFSDGHRSTLFSAAAFYPLFAGMCSPERAAQVVSMLPLLEMPYGVACCEKTGGLLGLQWDYPNGWACLQYIVVMALRRYGYKRDAQRIAEKYLALVDRVFQRSGQLWEKYDVCTGDISVSKEYQIPPMMGWTAGVYTAFQEIVHPRCS